MFRHRAGQSKIAQCRTVGARTVLDGGFDPAVYPHQHLAVEETVTMGS